MHPHLLNDAAYRCSASPVSVGETGHSEETQHTDNGVNRRISAPC
jgi:hypothetical protein